MTVVKEAIDLELDVHYEVTKYKHIYGSCGLVFLMQAKAESSNELIFVKLVKVEGNLYEYLRNKDDNYKFIVKRVIAETEESHNIINNIGQWIDLTSC